MVGFFVLFCFLIYFLSHSCPQLLQCQVFLWLWSNAEKDLLIGGRVCLGSDIQGTKFNKMGATNAMQISIAVQLVPWHFQSWNSSDMSLSFLSSTGANLKYVSLHSQDDLLNLYRLCRPWTCTQKDRRNRPGARLYWTEWKHLPWLQLWALMCQN